MLKPDIDFGSKAQNNYIYSNDSFPDCTWM